MHAIVPPPCHVFSGLVQGTRYKAQGTRYKVQGTRYNVHATGVACSVCGLVEVADGRRESVNSVVDLCRKDKRI